MPEVRFKLPSIVTDDPKVRLLLLLIVKVDKVGAKVNVLLGSVNALPLPLKTKLEPVLVVIEPELTEIGVLPVWKVSALPEMFTIPAVSVMVPFTIISLPKVVPALAPVKLHVKLFTLALPENEIFPVEVVP